MDREVFKKVDEIYNETNSVKETANRCKISEVKARRILITLGLWSSESSERVGKLSEQGFSTAQIAEKLSLSVKAVEAYLPYRRGTYGLGDKSAYALRSELYRDRKKTAEDHMVKANGDAFSDEAYKKLVFTDEDIRKVPAKHESIVYTEGAVCHLRFELVESDELDSTAKKLAKVQRSISRDVMVPGSMSLHALHYMIQKLFGWQNAHLHRFSLLQDDFDLVTAGRFGTYADLCGTLFRFPCDDTIDLYWDDDYENSVSVKTWLKSKYAKSPTQLAVCDTWVGNQQELQAFRKRFPEVADDLLLSELTNRIMFEQDLNQLSERMTVAELFTMATDQRDVRLWKGAFMRYLRKMLESWAKADQDDVLEGITQLHRWRDSLNGLKQRLQQNQEEIRQQIHAQFGISAEEMLQKHEQAIKGWCDFLYHVFRGKYNVALTPFFGSINYFYDYGDGWQIKITVVDVYKAQSGTDLGGGWEQVSISDSNPRYYHADGNEVEAELRDKLANIFYDHMPLCIAADGLNVLDDCGGVRGFSDMLKVIYGRDKEKSADRRSWANSLGWTGRRTAPENML